MKLLQLWAILLLSGFMLVNCNDNDSDYVMDEESPVETRPIATVYETTTKVKCRSSASIISSVVINLAKGQKVDLVDNDGASHADGYYWVHVYPRLSSKPHSCYIAARYLIPRH